MRSITTPEWMSNDSPGTLVGVIEGLMHRAREDPARLDRVDQEDRVVRRLASSDITALRSNIPFTASLPHKRQSRCIARALFNQLCMPYISIHTGTSHQPFQGISSPARSIPLSLHVQSSEHIFRSAVSSLVTQPLVLGSPVAEKSSVGQAEQFMHRNERD